MYNSIGKTNISNSSVTTKSNIPGPSLIYHVPLVNNRYLQNTNTLFKPQNSNIDINPVLAAKLVQSTGLEECAFQPELPFKTTKIESLHFVPNNKVEIANSQVEANLITDGPVLTSIKTLPVVAHQQKESLTKKYLKKSFQRISTITKPKSKQKNIIKQCLVVNNKEISDIKKIIQQKLDKNKDLFM